MATVIRMRGENKTKFVIKEGYQTIKKRIFDSRMFMEITFLSGKKYTVNKNDITHARASSLKISRKKTKKEKK